MAPGRRARRARKTESARTSLKDVAQATGFSITTVSAVLGGRADRLGIAGDTQATILAAAKALDYRPNLHARSLRSRTTTLVGLMVPTLNNRFFSEMAETFERVARNDGKLPLITVTNYDRREEVESLKYYLSQDVQCVFNANPTGLDELSALCDAAGTQQIFLDAPENAHHTVATDNHEASLVLSRVLLDSIAAEGRPGRVYFVGGMADHEVTKLRLGAFRTALQERGIRWSSELFVESLFNAESAYRRIELLFRSRDDVAGLYVNSLLPMDGVVRFFGENPDLCRPVHYGVFDHHPMMDLLVDLHIGAVRQHPELMMQRAWEIFADPDAHAPARLHHVAYDLIVAPTMRRFLPSSRMVGVGRARDGVS
jgi:DNA-binding LacI/PurR family transcriptional regulator